MFGSWKILGGKACACYSERKDRRKLNCMGKRGRMMFEAVILKLKAAKKVGIFTHVNPDGDAMGSAYGVQAILERLGKESAVFLSEKPDVAAYAMVWGKEPVALAVEDCDLLVALDCGDMQRLGAYGALFAEHTNTLSIDHHETHQPFAAVTVVDGQASSTCELIWKMTKEMELPLWPKLAHNLYLGIVTDTGSFKYSCVRGDTFRAAAELIETGIDFAKISKKIFNTKSLAYYQLMQIALDRLKLYDNGKIAVLYLSQADFDAAGLDEAEATGIVNIPTSIEGVKVGVYLRGKEDGSHKVSLRSVDTVDVARVAVALGGGGHLRASGYIPKEETIDEMIEAVLQEIRKQDLED